ncbi:nuclear receptor coactivator protein neosin [Musca autumnalis]|uniref:nuclear receptor coactivator protein neosin n=1 Tax=Musca autumnalis TaxID=221902 RepID=UPI003CF5374E
MAETAADKKSLAIIRDPNTVQNRIFIGNLPVCTREELESICLPYAKVLGSLVQKNFGFVQFESEEVANKVAKSLNKSTFKGNTITVRNANQKKPGKQQQQAGNKANTGTTGTTNSGQGNNASGGNWNQNQQNTDTGGGDDDNGYNGGYNDCEIIVVDRKNTKYAEMIEERLKRLNLRVDVLFPNEDVPLGKVLSNIASRGCLYAILVTNQHEEHNSITVNILYGQPAEHRNMPVDDAISLMAEDFRRKMMRDKNSGVAQANQNLVGNLPNPVPIIPALAAAPNYIAPPLKERHPDAIQTLLNLLAGNMPLTVLQYDRIIKYLQDRRLLQLKVELGDAEDESLNQGTPDPEIELQKKILNILNKPSVAETHYDLMYPSLDAVKNDIRLLALLKDIRVQKAIDSLMDSSLVPTIEGLMKF